MARAKRMQQTEIPGTEAKDVPDDVRDALHNWLDKTDEAKAATKHKQEAHEVLLQRADDAKLERVPYIDSVTGKKKHIVVASKRSVKVINAPVSKKKHEAEDRERPEIDAVIADPNADKVESRRVSRATVETELAEREAKVRAADGDGPLLVPDEVDGDPFAATRARMDAETTPTSETEH